MTYTIQKLVSLTSSLCTQWDPHCVTQWQSLVTKLEIHKHLQRSKLRFNCHDTKINRISGLAVTWCISVNIINVFKWFKRLQNIFKTLFKTYLMVF